MPQINDYADYDVLKTPGLYTIINKSSGTVLDLSNCNPAPDTTIIGLYVLEYPSRGWTDINSQSNSKHHGRDNQKWQIAAVGEQKYLIICKATGSYVRATSKSNPNLESRKCLTDARGWRGCQVQRWQSRP